jgi:hypothetical protein
MDDEQSKVNEATLPSSWGNRNNSRMPLNSEEIAILQMICDDCLLLIPARKHP